MRTFALTSVTSHSLTRRCSPRRLVRRRPFALRLRCRALWNRALLRYISRACRCQHPRIASARKSEPLSLGEGGLSRVSPHLPQRSVRPHPPPTTLPPSSPISASSPRCIRGRTQHASPLRRGYSTLCATGTMACCSLRAPCCSRWLGPTANKPAPVGNLALSRRLYRAPAFFHSPISLSHLAALSPSLSTASLVRRCGPARHAVQQKAPSSLIHQTIPRLTGCRLAVPVAPRSPRQRRHPSNGPPDTAPRS
jgi:hypothetical protein